MTAVAHCSTKRNRAISLVNQASPRRTSLASEELCARRDLAVVILTEMTIVVVEASVDSHVGKVSSPSHTSKLTIRKLPLSCDNRGIVVFKGASGDGLVPPIVCTGSAALYTVQGSGVSRNSSPVLQR